MRTVVEHVLVRLKCHWHGESRPRFGAAEAAPKLHVVLGLVNDCPRLRSEIARFAERDES
jgi:hypothetical protein